MKKTVSIARVCVLAANLWMALFVLVSCEKVVQNEDNDRHVSDGNLIVNVFDIEHMPFSSITTTRSAPAEACTRINYAVYSTDGTRIKQINQQMGDDSFGTAAFKLAEGDYYLAVVAHSSNGNPTMTDPNKIQFTNAQGYSDTFLCSGNISIGEEPVDMSISLNRIVALCRFVMTDDYPEDVTQMKFYYTGGSGAFNSATGLGCVNSKQTMVFDVTDGQTQFDLYTFLHDLEGTIHLTVTALDDSDNVLNERSFDVPLYQNHITWLTGAYFNGSSISASTITGIDLNTSWAGEHHVTF